MVTWAIILDFSSSAFLKCTDNVIFRTDHKESLRTVPTVPTFVIAHTYWASRKTWYKRALGLTLTQSSLIDQFRYIKSQSKTIDLSTRLVGINRTNSVVISTSLVLRSFVLDWILLYRNWSIISKKCDTTPVFLCRFQKTFQRSTFSTWF